MGSRKQNLQKTPEDDPTTPTVTDCTDDQSDDHDLEPKEDDCPICFKTIEDGKGRTPWASGDVDGGGCRHTICDGCALALETPDDESHKEKVASDMRIANRDIARRSCPICRRFKYNTKLNANAKAF